MYMRRFILRKWLVQLQSLACLKSVRQADWLAGIRAAVWRQNFFVSEKPQVLLPRPSAGWIGPPTLSRAVVFTATTYLHSRIEIHIGNINTENPSAQYH